MLKTLKRVAYYVQDLQAAKTWYERLLGTEPLYETPRAAIFGLGDCTLSLSLSSRPLPEGEDRMEVFWEVEDVDAAYRRLLELGARPVMPVTSLLSIRGAKVLDPFGNVLGLTGMAAGIEERTVQRQPSHTAQMTAFSRALSFLDEREEIRGPDGLAAIFLAEDMKRALQDEASRARAIREKMTTSLYGFLVARTAFMDGVFRRACDEGRPQIVILGAGYDTRALRFAERLRGTIVFELDIATTQDRKREALAANGIRVPEPLRFLPIDFKTEKIPDVLFRAGYRADRGTLFLWEGVTYYLPRTAIRDTVDFVASASPAGSLLAFDYMTEKTVSLNAAEPILSFTAREALTDWLDPARFRILENIDGPEMTRRYLTLRDGTPAEKAYSRFALALAEVS